MINLIKFLLGLKFGYIILIVFGLVIGGSLIRNIITGSFSLTKFASGFNPFLGQVQGKILYYCLIIFGCFVIYNFVMRPTMSYDTDYKNNIKGNRDVYLDQRVGDTCTEKCVLAIQPFGFTVLKVGCVKSCTASITQTTKVEAPKDIVKDVPKIIETTKKLNPFSAPFRWIGKLFR